MPGNKENWPFEDDDRHALKQILRVVLDIQADVKLIKGVVVPRPVKSLAVRVDKPINQE